VLPEGLPWSAATLIEPLANAVHAWSLPLQPPATVAVVGAGPIGLLCGLVARAHAAEVDITEPLAERRAVAESLGLHPVGELAREYDAVIDAAGLPETRRTSVDHTRPGGTTVWLGLAEDAVTFSGNTVVRAEKIVRGSFAYTANEFAEAVELAPRLDLSWTTDVPLSEAAEVFYSLAEGRSDLIKAVLVPEGL
jgi:threonine dehydrogenase-like Zn-dependent dehydrogenase